MIGPRPVTLITGASAGIGAELARVFARHHHELVLVARRADRLASLADEIAATGEPRPVILAIDLTEAHATERVAEALAAQSLEPQFIVNSAGFGLLGPAAELDQAAQLTMIDLNVRAITELSLRFVDSLERHRGGILNVASLFGFMPGPGMAVYHATKAYVISFTEALHQELSEKGIRVSVLCPGPVDTEFAVRPDSYYTRKLVRTVGRVAQDGYAGVMQGQRVIMTGKLIKVLRFMMQLLPRNVVLSMVDGSQRKNLDVKSGQKNFTG